MLKLGEKIISDIYLGDKKIAKVFLGDKLVYQAGKPIFLDYIETDGNSYIDTGYCPNENTYIEYDFEVTTKVTTTYAGLFGSRENTTAYPYNVFARASEFRLDFGRYSDSATVPYTLNTRYLMKAGLGEIYLNEELVKTYKPVIKQLQYSMFLGNSNNDGTRYNTGTAQKIYGFKAYENNVLLHDFRPCIHPNGTVCFYDTVTKKYFYNQGTGTLKAGGRFVESIVSDGNCYINTGIKASYDYTIKTKYMYTSFVGAYNCIFGTRSEAVSEGNKIYWVGCNSTGTKDLMMRMGKTTLPYSLKLNEVIDLEITPNEAIINGTNLGDAMFDGEIGFDSNIYLFNINMNSDGSTALFASVAIMYNFQIYNNNMELIQDLRPYVDADGVACFKDLVTNTLFYNKGAGTLTYTE